MERWSRGVSTAASWYSGDHHDHRNFHHHHHNNRPFPYGPLPDRNNDGLGFVKLYVGDIPRTVTEEEIRSVFEVHGSIVEIAIVKDPETGMQRTYCFVKYTTVEEADRAIAELHNRYTFPGARFSVKVRYADGEIERIRNPGDHFSKLYVMGLNVHATKWEIGEIFSAYGQVEHIYIVCDEYKQSRGRAFVHFARRDMAIAAKEALSGRFIMAGCDEPLFIRFAEPKKPRFGHPWNNSNFGDSVVSSHFEEPFVRTLAPHLNDSMAKNELSDVPRQFSSKSTSSSDVPHQFSSKSTPSSDVPHQFSSKSTPSSDVPHQFSSRSTPSSDVPHQFSSKSTPPSDVSHQFSSRSTPSSDVPHQISSKSTPSSDVPHQISSKSTPSSDVPHQFSSRSTPSSDVPHQISSKSTPSSDVPHRISSKSTPSSDVPHQFSSRSTPSSDVPHQFSSKSTPSSSQSPRSGTRSDTVSSTPTGLEPADSLDCDWSEHTCPDGNKYYYNCETCESLWEKPEEYALFEQKLQKQQQLEYQ